MLSVQHNLTGPVKPTHHNSISPTRGMSRYSPTHSSVNLGRRPSPQRLMHDNLTSNLTRYPSLISLHILFYFFFLSLSLFLDLNLSQQQQQLMNANSLSTPTSPSHPSNQSSLPALEFTITNYNGNIVNGSLTVGNGNGGYNYRNNNNNPNSNESLPASPQSQQSCFNSPQGSPGPISISPQDVNPFTSVNSYDQMHKKFDQINLDSSGGGGYNYSMAPSLTLASPPSHKHSNGLVDQKNGVSNNNNNNNNNSSSSNNENKMSSMINNNANGVMLDLVNENNNNNTNTSTNSANNTNSNNSRSGSLSSSGSGMALNGLSSNGMIEDIDLQSLQNQQANLGINLGDNGLRLDLNNNNNNSNVNINSLLSKTHKNSIPNIILTYSGGEHHHHIFVVVELLIFYLKIFFLYIFKDSIEEKNDLIIKDLSNDEPINFDSILDASQLDVDSNGLNQNLESTLYQNS